MQSTSSWLARLYGWACRRLYHELATSYDFISQLVSLGRWPAWRLAVLEHLVIQQPAGRPPRVLELGFGTGELILALMRRGLRPIGLEPSAEMHRITRSKLRRAALRAPLVCSLAQTMPFAGGSFDVVVATFPAEYILHEQSLHEIARVLTSVEANASPGRLIVVGLWVSLASPVLARLCPLFYGEPSPSWTTQVEERLAMAGLTAEWTVYADGFARVSVLEARCTRPSL